MADLGPPFPTTTMPAAPSGLVSPSMGKNVRPHKISVIARTLYVETPSTYRPIRQLREAGGAAAPRGRRWRRGRPRGRISVYGYSVVGGPLARVGRPKAAEPRELVVSVRLTLAAYRSLQALALRQGRPLGQQLRALAPVPGLTAGMPAGERKA